jgi:nucleoside-diphosphate-sugar epimerase
LAERAAWAFIEQENPQFDLVTINPPLVFGPVVHHLNSLDAINTSNARIKKIIQGENKSGLPLTGSYLWVDVRDVAFAHVRAIEVPEAGGQRFFAVGGYFTNKMIADIIREDYPEKKSILPPEDVADDLPVDVYGYDNKKSIEVLGLKYRTLKETVGDTVKLLLEIGV